MIFILKIILVFSPGIKLAEIYSSTLFWWKFMLKLFFFCNIELRSIFICGRQILIIFFIFRTSVRLYLEIVVIKYIFWNKHVWARLWVRGIIFNNFVSSLSQYLFFFLILILLLSWFVSFIFFMVIFL